MNAILVCVDYADYLAVTLAYNRDHFGRVMVVTSPRDIETQKVASRNDAECHVTDAFYCDGALFRKWLALEEGLVRFLHGSRGNEWFCIMDADVLWPRYLDHFQAVPGNLYTPRRRMMADPSACLDARYKFVVPREDRWNAFPLHPQQQEFAGYSQIFHLSDQKLGPLPWHETNWTTAGGADSFFQAKWPVEKKIRPPFEVLHLGAAGTNWAGRVEPYLDGRTPLDAAKRREQLADLMRQRSGKSGRERFRAEMVGDAKPAPRG
jgi:hypothetical protein